MSLIAGTLLGPYEIVAPLGAGGMGEVYRARDTKLGRDVALKFLPTSFVHDPDRVARFRREAHVLASLNHPHIGAIYGLDEAQGQQFLVLELVEGHTLAELLMGSAAQSRKSEARGLPIDEALAIARQIADALEAAHERGIVHRDLKPGNIMVTRDGSVKVLDFGLAKADPAAAAVEAADLSHSPTLTIGATEAHVILGTAAYMAPEQVKGRGADKRSDVWAFGCVLYEVLAGTPAFGGDDAAEIMASIVRADPDWNRLPPETPASVRALLGGCLEKDRGQRVSDIAVATFLLDPQRLRTDASAIRTVPEARHWPNRWRGPAIAVASAAAGASVVWITVRLSTPAAVPPHVARMAVATTPATAMGRTGADHDIAISPDGTRIVYVGANGALLLRSFDQLDATPIPGLDAARGPFFSPDGRWIGFFDGDGSLKKVVTTGGSPVTICAFDSNSRGAAWLEDDTIVFATQDPATGLWRVSAAGGKPTPLTTPERTVESDHLWPHAVPGLHAVIFTIASASRPFENPQTAMLDLDSGKKTVLFQGGSDARYLATGHLVYLAAVAGNSSTIRAVKFDLEHGTAPGPAIDVASNIVTAGNLGSNFDVSRNGTLVYSTTGDSGRTLAWVDRQGREEPINAPPRVYVYARLSPDARRVALDVRDEQSDIWIWELARQTLTRLTTDPAPDRFPVWAADGRSILFTSDRHGTANVYRQSVDATTPAERLSTSPNPQATMSVSPDGNILVVRESAPNFDLMRLALTGTRRVAPLVKTGFLELNGEISPDGRWLAYEANDSGQFQIYVRAFPNVDAGRWQVSSGGGTQPLWSRDGHELFFLAPSGALMATRLQRGADWAASPPERLSAVPNLSVGQAIVGTARSYDVGLDGRFLIIKAPSRGSVGLIVVMNWFEELQRLAPGK